MNEMAEFGAAEFGAATLGVAHHFHSRISTPPPPYGGRG